MNTYSIGDKVIPWWTRDGQPPHVLVLGPDTNGVWVLLHEGGTYETGRESDFQPWAEPPRRITVEFRTVREGDFFLGYVGVDHPLKQVGGVVTIGELREAASLASPTRHWAIGLSRWVLVK